MGGAGLTNPDFQAMTSPPPPPAAGRLDGRIALVTGASRGIGAAVAKRLAAEGAEVVITARTVGGLEEVDDEIRAAGGKGATLIPLDLMNLDEIDQLGPLLHQRFGRLDIVVGNAGTLGALAPVAYSDPKIIQRLMTVNVLANYRLIRTLDPLLRQSDAGRAIFVTDLLEEESVNFWGLYRASKHALEAMVRAYAAEVTRPELLVNLVHPGPVATALRAKAYPGEDRSRLARPEDVVAAFADLADPACRRHGETVHARPRP
jgi:NAD(P)-dependent dehydrogenase (short-subunit alcohol dehydrogenase family)